MERFRRWVFFLGFRVWGYFCLDQVLWAPGFGAPTWVAAAAAAWRRVVLWVSRGGGGAGGGVRVSCC